MFGLFKKDPTKGLEKKLKVLLKEAMETQRSGDLRKYAVQMSEIEELEKKIIELKK